MEALSSMQLNITPPIRSRDHPDNQPMLQDKTNPTPPLPSLVLTRRTKKETGEILHRKTRFLLLPLKPVSLFFELKARPGSDLETTITC